MGAWGGIDEYFSPEYVAHAGDKEFRGHGFLKQFSKQLRTAIPTIQVGAIEFFVHADDTVAWQRRLSGINESALRGIPASGRKVTWTEMVITRFEKGKIAEEWIVSELMGELLLLAPREK